MKKTAGGGRPAERERQAPPERRPHRQKFNPEDMLDLHLRLGLEDHWVRVSKEHYGIFVREWKISGLDVVFRSVYQTHEANIIVRGSQGGYESAQPCDPDRNIPVYNVLSVMEMRRKILEQQGIE